MYRILVADDEAVIREGIKHLFNYEELGFTICGEASNGDNALSQILSLHPDVVFLDIRMPGMSGLDTIRLAREQGFQGTVIIISSYTDFKYAQEAMRYGAQYYVLKPIDDDELKNILISLREHFDAESTRRTSSDLYRQKARSVLIADILSSEFLPSDSQLVELELAADRYQIVLLQRPSGSTGTLNLGSGCAAEYDHILLDGQEVLFLRGESAIERLKTMAQFNAITAHGNAESRSFFACGPVVSTLQDVPLSYRKACLLMERRFFCDPDQYLLEEHDLPDFDDACTPDADTLHRYASAILDGITSFNRRVIAQSLKQLEDQLFRAPVSIAAIRLFLTDLYLQVKMQIRQLYAGTEIPFLSNAEIISTISDASYLYEIIRFFSQRFEVFMDATGISTRDSVLNDILHYIHCNYASNITLENIAPLFGYNRSYLGKIFTRKMGQNFNSYLDTVRIERSKEMLLQDEAKVYVIAERIGYKNVDYFHIKFRKYVGMSPSEYRRKNKCSSCSAHAQNTADGAVSE